MSVYLEGREIAVPQVQGNSEVFTHFRFFFVKPKWLADESCNACPICDQNFTTLRRKHHCRNCGKVLCSKCCNQKVPLPQYALDEPQRTCIICRDVAELVAKSRSQFISHRQEAAVGLANMLKNHEDLCKVVACGGIQTIISLTSQGDSTIWGAVATSTHLLAQHFPLHQLLMKSGTIQAISYLLETSRGSNEDLLVECLTTLSLLSSNKLVVTKVLELVDFGSVEELLFSCFGTVTLLAARVIHSLVKQLELQNFILQHSFSLVQSVLKALKTDNVQMQDQILRILTCLSAGGDHIKHKIICADNGVSGSFLIPFLEYKSVEQCHILESALCLLGNLATSSTQTSSNQTSLQPYISPVLELLGSKHELSITALTHMARALANFAEVPVNALPLVNSLPVIVSTLLSSNSDGIRMHACRIVIGLMNSEPSATLECLNRNGADDFLEALFGVPGMSEILTNTILKTVSKLSMGIL